MSDLSTHALVAELEMGKQAQSFLASDVGRYMLARIEEEERQAIEALSTVWPWRRRRITQLQNQLWRARSFKEWLAELIVQGRQAEQQLDAPEE